METKIKALIILIALCIVSLQCSDDDNILQPQKMSKEQVGKQIFNDVSLSDPPGQACGTCHASGFSFTDPDHSIVSHGAHDYLFGKRNAPTAGYTMFTPPLHYDDVEKLYIGGLFLDGRVNSLQDQAKLPFFQPDEMNLADMDMFVFKVKNSGFYPSFVEIYGESNDGNTILNNVVDAITAFEKTPEVNPFTSKFDYYLKGQASLSELETMGMEIFTDTAKGKCANCHIIDPDPKSGKVLFTDFTYDNIGVPKNPFNPFYKMPAEINPEGPAFIDYGLAKTTNDPKNNGQIKVPTLRNVAVTAPYFHNGVFGTLEEVVHFYNARDVDPSIPPPEVTGNVNDEELGNLELSKSEERALVAFLKTLTDGYK